MKSAFRNFAIATLAVLFLLFGSWVFLRHRALTQPLKPAIEHPFLDRLVSGHPLVIAYQGHSQDFPPNTMIALEAAAKISPDVALWIDVRPTRDGTLVVYEPKDLSATTDGEGWVQFKTFTELRALDAAYKFSIDGGNTFPFRGQKLTIPTLEEVLAKFPDRYFILNFQDYKGGVAEKIIATIEAAMVESRVLIASPEDGLLSDLREQRPRWVFGTSQPQATVLSMLSQMGLAPVAPLRGDVFVTPTARGASLFRLDERIKSELRRRKMKIVMGPARDEAEALRWRTDGIEGIATRTPSSLLH